jgi:hypothetical protein
VYRVIVPQSFHGAPEKAGGTSHAFRLLEALVLLGEAEILRDVRGDVLESHGRHGARRMLKVSPSGQGESSIGRMRCRKGQRVAAG